MDGEIKKLYQQIKKCAGNRKCFVDFQNEKLTYHQLLRTVERLATCFRDHACITGSRVLIFTRNDKHAITLCLSALLEGLTPVILPVETKKERAQALLQKVAPQLVFIDAQLHQTWEWLAAFQCIPVVEEKQKIHRLLNILHSREIGAKDCYPNILEKYASEAPLCGSQGESLAFITFSSGTTSAPKGIPISRDNLFVHLATLSRIFSYGSGSVIFNNMSLAHVDGLVQGPMLALYAGAELFRPQSFTVQNMEFLLNTLYSKRVTHCLIVPTILSLIDRLTEHDDYFDGEEFQYLISVAGKLDRNLWQRIQERFGIRVNNMYGLSETVTGGFFCGPDDDTFVVGTIGKPVDMEATIVKDSGDTAIVGESGELLLKGPNVFPGYLDAPEASVQIFYDGWLRTGDIAQKRIDGTYEIVGRKKSVIISGGFNIQPDEIDEVLRRYPAVVDSVTIGVGDDEWGEIVMSAVEAETNIDETALIEHCRIYLESHKIPKKIVSVDSLPRGISGKIILPEIRCIIMDATGNAVKGEAVVAIEEIIVLASSVFKIAREKLSANMSSDDVPGWDSLGHLNLITRVEDEFDVQFSMDEMMSVDSFTRLLEVIKAKVESP